MGSPRFRKSSVRRVRPAARRQLRGTNVQSGDRHLSYTTQKASNRQAQLSINGTILVPIAGQYPLSLPYVRIDRGNFNFPTAGTYNLKFLIIGKNVSSSGCTLAFDDIILTPQ